MIRNGSENKQAFSCMECGCVDTPNRGFVYIKPSYNLTLVLCGNCLDKMLSKINEIDSNNDYDKGL